ncbi:peptidylprolyl isomerase [Variovorax ureilyticus]|uniref:peptidylprolyl isomerase n=1 Tax=Variovorax ureilyticus TaxID=1836198 RepID=UPI003D671F00
MKAKVIALALFAGVAAHAQVSGSLPDERGMYHEAHVYHIMLRSEGDAQAVFATLQRAPKQRLLAAFKGAAADKSIDPGSRQAGGDLGLIKEGTMVRPFEIAAFALAPGQMSSPVQTEFGWHLLYVASAKSTPVAQLCEQTLKAHLNATRGLPANVIALTKSERPGMSGFEGKVTRMLGPLWGPPLKDMDGNLTFLRAGSTDASGNTEVLQHTEYPYARLNISPMACKRSERTRFQVNCHEGTVQMQSVEEQELRGGQGLVVNRRSVSTPRAISKSEYGGFLRQVRDLACATGLKT